MSADNKSHIRSFLEYLEVQRNYSPHTISNYQRELTRFSELCGTDYTTLKPHDLTHFVGHLHSKGLAPASIQRALSAVRSFFGYLVAQSVMTSNPASATLTPKRKRKLPKVLDPDQASALLRNVKVKPESSTAPNQQTPNTRKHRDYAMFELLYGAGLRVSELVALDIEHVDLEAGICQGIR